ncbi:hypothetical protein [Anaeromyxobacter diazotrophicus]|uniref:Lipoprotein n=1 Tax=Anaeromyxobacter diazotrophicus TaxID=2590199 RepID=A0A7I9VGJ1_9BACT|nr:hypothetical protein [Anaeromyxobacter diazotrophicus]GEJ55516.1 hypothetical protein AMYX_02570 [Anaeromyxobacter diazotrophicus]
MTPRLALLALLLAAGCAHRPEAVRPAQGAVSLPRRSAGPYQPEDWQLAPGAVLGERNRCVDRELTARRLNEFGDPEGTTYPGGSPLLGLTGRAADRYEYVMRRQPDIGTVCSRAPGDPQR